MQRVNRLQSFFSAVRQYANKPARAAGVSSLASSRHMSMSCVKFSQCTLPLRSTRHFATSDASEPSFPEKEFHLIADETLDTVQETIESLEELVEDIDVTLSQGVLTAQIGKHGTWVINKQTPNRQIWWSSPISGPRRYEYDEATKTWINTRDRMELLTLLRTELQMTTGYEIE